MSDLADFLLARIAETEDAARAEASRRREAAAIDAWKVGRAYITIGGPLDPARVLAECEAKRQIVALHQQYPGPPGSCGWCTCDEEVPPCATLQLLALPYADHPDYRQEWRP